MLVNGILDFFQNFFNKMYSKSFILKNIDYLIFLNIFAVIFFSAFAQSDNIGYFAIFGIILTVIKLLTKPNEKITMSTGDKFLLGYFLVVLISVAGSSLFFYSLKGFCKTLVYLGYYITVVHYLNANRKMLPFIIITIAGLGFIESFFALQQNFLSVEEISGWQDVTHLNPEEVMTRVYGTLKPYNPNLFGGYMLSVLPSALIFVLIPLIKGYKKLSCIGLIPFLAILFAIIMTGCRGAYVGLFAVLLLIIISSYRFLEPVYKKIYKVFLSVVAILSCTFVMLTTSLRARILSIFMMRGDTSNSFRFNVYHSCIEMFKDNWLFGIGVGNQNFREIYGLYMKTGFDALSAYNIYLETAVESGIFAIIFFLAFVVYNISVAIKYILTRTNTRSVYLLIATLSIIGLLIHGFVDTVFFRPQLQFIFWTMIAIIRVVLTGYGKLISKGE